MYQVFQNSTNASSSSFHNWFFSSLRRFATSKKSYNICTSSFQLTGFNFQNIKMQARKNQKNEAHGIPFDDPLIAASIANSVSFWGNKKIHHTYTRPRPMWFLLYQIYAEISPEKNPHTRTPARTHARMHVISCICDENENNGSISKKRRWQNTKSSFNKTIIEYQPSANRFLCKLSCKYIQYYVDLFVLLRSLPMLPPFPFLRAAANCYEVIW